MQRIASVTEFHNVQFSGPVHSIYVSCSFSMSSQSLSVALHWWSGVISASQFEHMDFLEGTGVKTSGAGEGRPFKQGEIEEGELTGRGGLLSFSGDSSLSKI